MAIANHAGLTRQQSKLLAFLEAKTVEGKTPSFEEMKQHLGLASKSGVARLIDALEQRGRISRKPHLARAIEVLDVNELAKFSLAQLHDEIYRRKVAA